MFYYKNGLREPVTETNPLPVALNVPVAVDAEIGAVELKNATTDDRAEVVNADQAPSSTKYGLLTRVVGLLTALGGVTETAPANDTASSGLNGRLQRIAQRLTSLIALLPTSLGASGGLKVDGAGYASVVGLTRTNDTNAYNAGDVVGAATGSTAALTFANIGPTAGGEVMLTTVQFEIDLSAVISGMTSYRLYLYNVTPPSALGDNAAWDLPSGDRASFLGYVDLGVPVDLGSTLYVETLQVNKQLTVPSGGSLFGYLVTVGGFTPSASIVHKITLHAAGL